MTASFHHLGTTRMGADESHGVVDNSCKCLEPKGSLSLEVPSCNLRVCESNPDDRRPVNTAGPPYRRDPGDTSSSPVQRGRKVAGAPQTTPARAGRHKIRTALPWSRHGILVGSLAFEKGCSHDPGKYRWPLLPRKMCTRGAHRNQNDVRPIIPAIGSRSGEAE
jgi:hypothetical protein